jgi:hypothetical protein
MFQATLVAFSNFPLSSFILNSSKEFQNTIFPISLASMVNSTAGV